MNNFKPMIASAVKGLIMQPQVPQLYKQQTNNLDANNLNEGTKKQLEAKAIELTNILRWEDDGGIIVQTIRI